MTARTYLSLWRGVRPWPLSMCELAAEIAERRGVTVKAIRGRDHSAGGARQSFVSKARAAGKSLNEIGRFLDRRHHTTILYIERQSAPIPLSENSENIAA